jgi:hypothetical protein
MALIWINQSRSATYDRGKWTGTQNYLVRDGDDASINVYTIASNASTYEPFGGGNDATMATYLRFISATYTPVADGMDKLWSAVFSYESKMGDGTNVTAVDSLSEQEVGFTSIETSISATTVDIYRTGATLPSNKSVPTLIDIGGTKVDSSGEPISYVLPMTNISVRNVIYGRPSYAAIMALAGKRNAASFTVCGFTAAADTLLFTGCSSSRTAPNTYEINFQFTYDPNEYHLRQVPLRDVDGRVMTSRVTPGSAVSESNPERADKVYYKQPFGTGDFSNLNIVST